MNPKSTTTPDWNNFYVPSVSWIGVNNMLSMSSAGCASSNQEAVRNTEMRGTRVYREEKRDDGKNIFEN